MIQVLKLKLNFNKIKYKKILIFLFIINMNYTYIFIMILVLVMLYGLLFRLKNKKIINTIESFENKTNLENINEIYASAVPKFAEGTWTSNSSEIISDEITNTLKFIIDDKSNGIMDFNNKKFKVKINPNSTLETNEIDGEKYLFNPNPNDDSYRLPFDIDDKFKNVPVFEMIDQSDDKRSLIFKFINGKLNESVKSLISNKSNNYDPTEPNIRGVFFSPSVIENIQNYKFRSDALTPIYISKQEYSRINNLSPVDADKKINKLKEIYNNRISFQIKRRFNFSNNQNLDTKFSRLYTFKFEDNNKILNKLIHKKLVPELSENKLNTKFYDISSFIYLHKVSETKDIYEFSKPKFLFNKNDLELENDAKNFVTDNLSGVDLNSVQRVIDSKFKPKVFSLINTYNQDNKPDGTNITSKINISEKSLNVN